MSTTGNLAVVRFIQGTEVEKWDTTSVQMLLNGFQKTEDGKNPRFVLFYGKDLEDGYHVLTLDPESTTKLNYTSSEGIQFAARGEVKITVSGFKAQQIGEIDATLTDSSGQVFGLKGDFEGKNKL